MSLPAYLVDAIARQGHVPTQRKGARNRARGAPRTEEPRSTKGGKHGFAGTFLVDAATLKTLPPRVDLRPECPPVYDQGPVGSSVGQALAAAFEFSRRKQGLESFTPSRLFIYYNARLRTGAAGSDSGAMILDGLIALNEFGAPPERSWPYKPDRVAVKPSAMAYQEAKPFARATSYKQISQDLGQLKGCLASGYPIILGFAVYASLTSAQVAKTGRAPMPGSAESVVGGHAVLIVGYNDSTQTFWGRNSWGVKWGIKGYFTLPYAYLLGKDASDFWTLRSVW